MGRGTLGRVGRLRLALVTKRGLLLFSVLTRILLAEAGATWREGGEGLRGR